MNQRLHGRIEVRPARPEELARAGAVAREAYLSDRLLAPDNGYAARLADAAGRARDAVVAVAVEADVVVGTVTYAPAGSRWAQLACAGEAEFRMLGVQPTHRGRGVGEALVRWCADRARKSGMSQLVLCSTEEMLTAHRLYRRLGFRRRPDLDWTPEPGVRLLGFCLDLTSPGLGRRHGLRPQGRGDAARP
jgi:GNAT superfamily N-acetyltransferase